MADITGEISLPGTHRPTREAWGADAGFYLTMTLVSAVIIFLGFSPSFYLKSVLHAPPPLSLLTITHGLVFTGWVLLFVTQPALIPIDKPALHRQLGINGAILFGVILSLGVSTAITAGRLGHAPPGAPAPLVFMALPLLALVLAFFLVAGALMNRRRSDWHKRLMLASIFVMTGPAVGRLAIPAGFAEQGSWLAIIGGEILLAISLAYDFHKHRKCHPAYLFGAAAFLAYHLGVAWAFQSPAWLAFAKAITQPG